MLHGRMPHGDSRLFSTDLRPQWEALAPPAKPSVPHPALPLAPAAALPTLLPSMALATARCGWPTGRLPGRPTWMPAAQTASAPSTRARSSETEDFTCCEQPWPPLGTRGAKLKPTQLYLLAGQRGSVHAPALPPFSLLGSASLTCYRLFSQLTLNLSE